MKRIAIVVAILTLFAGHVSGQVVPPKATGYVPLTPERRAHFQKLSHDKHGNRLAMMAKNQALPSSFDARVKVPLPVWDQGACGSCYLVSTVRTATSTLVAGGYGKPDDTFKLSSQFGMDRPRNFGACNGGNGTEVIDWMISNGWPAEIYVDPQGVVHKDYPPYEARSGNDRTKAGAKLWMKGADWGFVNSNGRPTTLEIKTALYNYGRLNIAIDAGGQFGNGTGTITALGNNIDHEINCVAYDDAKGAFLLENQWGTEWGVDGCRWVTYAAAAHIVDWFYVTASPLPPPPPDPPVPPTPPVPPIPPADGINLAPGTSFFVGPVRFNVPSGVKFDPKMTLEDFAKLLQGGAVKDAPMKATPEPEPLPNKEIENLKNKVLELEQYQIRTLELIESMQKMIGNNKPMVQPKIESPVLVERTPLERAIHGSIHANPTNKTWAQFKKDGYK